MGHVQVDHRAHEGRKDQEAAHGGEVIVRLLAVGLGKDLHNQVDCCQDSAHDDLRDAALLQGDEEADEEEAARHLDELVLQPETRGRTCVRVSK